MINRIKKLQLKINSLSAVRNIGLASALFAFLPNAHAQFSLNTDTNPLSMDVGTYSSSTFVDIDDDGDFDAFLGDQVGDVDYYENTGTTSNPTFVLRSGTDNPLNSVTVVNFSKVEFLDMDNDGDQDALIGGNDGNFEYWENTGSKASPAFVERTGGSNPMNVDIGSAADPTSADLDNDGDIDLVIGEYNGYFYYYENTGSAASPDFVYRTGTDSPFNGQKVTYYASTDLFDYDNDGDFDLVAGDYFSGTDYWENTGSVSTPEFIKRTGTDNPFNSITDYGYSSPAAVDIDGNGVQDIFMGNSNGDFYFLQKDGFLFLPVELIEFTAEPEEDGVMLKWSTATEDKNDRFEVQRSTNGRDYETIGIVDGAGDSEQILEYQYEDLAPPKGNLYYRLKQVDFNGDESFVGFEQVTMQNSTVSIYPNPMIGQEMNLMVNFEIDQSHIILATDMMGRKIPIRTFIESGGKARLEFDSQPSGAFGIIHVLDASNNLLFTQKVMFD